MLACPDCRKLYPNDATSCEIDGAALVPLEKLPDGDPHIERGTMLGEYRVDDKLGSGTFGDVYAGEQPVIGKHVAIKVLHHKYTSNGGVVSRFIAEARAVNRIRHQNIIDIFSFGMHAEKQPYFVMERLEGMTLGALLELRKRLPVAEALPILRGIAKGLDAAHEAGITHRDLKPDNIFLVAQKDGGYFPKLLDFGVAKLLDDDVAHKTATGAAIGTPRYMAPEQCRGKPVDHRADVYALGVVVHEMLTGRPLFQAESAMDVLFKHVSEAPPPMSEAAPDLPAALDAPVLAMLAKSPNARPFSAGAAITALAEAAESTGTASAVSAGGKPSAVSARSAVSVPALADRQAETIAEGARPPADLPATHADSSAPTRKSAGQDITEASGPVVISVGDAAKTDVDVASARTMLAPSSPASGTLVAGAPPSSALGRPTLASAGKPEATEIEPPPARPDPPPAHPHPTRKPAWPFAVAAGAVVIAGAFMLSRGDKPAVHTAESASVVQTARPLPGKVSIHLTVTPADADVIVDGLRAGSASEPIALPRGERSLSIRIEKPGFEPQTLLIVPDRDHELPPIALRPAPAAPTATQAPSAPKMPPAKVVHPDLERPDR